jgi:serine/threonine-protein kinase
MEYLEGRTLAQALRQANQAGQRVPEWFALEVVSACCDGLQYAHDLADDGGAPLGVLHRDISPANLMLSFTGRVTVLDFGIAVTTRSGRTRSGAIKGKYPFMAPERIRGGEADRRSDIYSLGVVLYLLLAWRRPFEAPSDYELLRRMVNEAPPPPSRFNPGIAPELDAIVLRAIAPRPADRYEQASELGADLRSYLRRSASPVDHRDLAMYMSTLFAGAQEIPAHLRVCADTGPELPDAPPLPAASALAPPPRAPIDEGSLSGVVVDVLELEDAEDGDGEVTLRRDPAGAPPEAAGASAPPASTGLAVPAVGSSNEPRSSALGPGIEMVSRIYDAPRRLSGWRLEVDIFAGGTGGDGAAGAFDDVRRRADAASRSARAFGEPAATDRGNDT